MSKTIWRKTKTTTKINHDAHSHHHRIHHPLLAREAHDADQAPAQSVGILRPAEKVLVAKDIQKMNWDFFNGFWAGGLSMILVLIALIWSVPENADKEKRDDDDYHYEPIDDDHDHFQPA